MNFPEKTLVKLMALSLSLWPLAPVLSQTDIGASGLEWSGQLGAAAQMKAEDMAQKGYFAHTSPDGLSPWHWFYEVGCKPRYAGENLALSLTPGSDFMKHWMASAKHRNNLLNKNYTEIGIGIARGKYAGREVYYIVQLFGNPGTENPQNI